MGTELPITDEGATYRITVFAVDNAAAPGAPKPQSGDHYAAVDAQFCLDSTPNGVAVSLSWNPWTVADSSNGNYPADSSTYQQFPRPEYPFAGDLVQVGECVRGSIVFAMAPGAKVVTVKYGSSTGGIGRWTA